MNQDASKTTSLQAIRMFGGLIAVLLLAVLAAGIRTTHRIQLDAAQHRAGELASNAARIVEGPLRSSTNAVIAFAEESRRMHRVVPEHADALLQDIASGIRRRQSQLQDLVVIPTAPRSGASSGQGVSDAARCTNIEAPLPCFGTVENRAQTQVIPVATPLDDRQWVVGYIDVAALARMLRHLQTQTNEKSSLAIVDHRGITVVGQGAAATNAAAGSHDGDTWPRGDTPIEATVPIGAYPFSARVWISSREALWPWYRQIIAASLFYLFYLSAFAYVLMVVSRASRAQRHYLKSLQTAAHDLRLAQHVGRTAIWSLTDHAQRFQCSDDVGSIFGLPPEQTTATLEEFFAVVFPSDRTSLIEQVRTAWKNGTPLRTEFRIHHPDGSLRRLSASGEAVRDEAGEKRMTGTVVDVTEQWEARQRQEESEQRFTVLFEQHPLPFWTFDASTLRFLEVNAAAVRSYGYTREEFLAMSILDIRDPQDRGEVITDLTTPEEGTQPQRIWTHRRKNGSPIEVRIHSAGIVFDGRPARMVLAEDVTAHLADERELAYRASHDLTTGLPNQRALMEWMDVLIAGGTSFEVAYLQLLGMDAIADTFGINVAADILQTVSARLTQLAGSGFLAAVTHEAFVYAVTAGALTEATLKTFVDRVAEPLHYEDTQHQLSVLIGVACHPQDGTQSDVLLGRAALAAHAHLRSDQPVHHFKPALAHASRERLNFAARLRHAIKHHDFELHYQVITQLADRRTIGLEALIRWPQGDGTFISPASFIPMCEEAGLIVPLGRWVLSEAAKASRELREAGFNDLNIGINVSAAELRAGDLVASLRATRDAFALPDDALYIELTESSLIEQRDRAIMVMKQLRAMGFTIALDDFGTGFSSLSYLRDLPIDTLKIDQTFIRNVDWDARSAAICDAIIALGKSLKVNIVAEGVESALQYQWLHAHGCDGAQGYYLGKPEPLPALLAQWSAR